MIFLFGMFVVGQALEESGYLAVLSHKLFSKARSADGLFLLVLFSAGISSMVLMNDTLAIIGTPVVLSLARKHSLQPKAMLLALAFGITIGSVASPIGNPQNLLIAVNGNVASPFITFPAYLLLPTLANLFLAFVVLKLFYGGKWKALNHSGERIRDPRLARASKISLALVLVCIAVKVLLVSIAPSLDFRLTYIALAGTLPVIAFGPKRLDLVRRIDWHTLVFFAAMFIVMESVWNSGFIQEGIRESGADFYSIPVILASSVLLSQLISNVPLVALSLPLLQTGGDLSIKALMALAAGSTIAGNMLILGAASNVIIIQNGEKKSGETLSFFEFAKIGVPLTILNTIMYWAFLSV